MLSRRGGVTGDFGGAGLLVGGTETAAGAEAEGAVCVDEGPAGTEGVRSGLTLADGVVTVGVPEGFLVDVPDSESCEQPAAAGASPSTATTSPDTAHGPRFRTIPPPKNDHVMRGQSSHSGPWG
jgi:hypothetical protein